MGQVQEWTDINQLALAQIRASMSDEGSVDADRRYVSDNSRHINIVPSQPVLQQYQVPMHDQTSSEEVASYVEN